MRTASPCLSVWTGEDHDIAVRVLDPDLPMLWSGVDVWLQEDPSAEASDAIDGSVEVVDLEPEKDAMAVGRTVGPHEVRVLLLVPGVQLQDERVSTREAVVEEAVRMVRASTNTEQRLVPGAAGRHVPHCNQWLRPDCRSIQLSHRALGAIILLAVLDGDRSEPTPCVHRATPGEPELVSLRRGLSRR
jgi:hypothetical protein